MKRLFYLLVGLVLLPTLIFAQTDYSGKGLYNFITANYYNTTDSYSTGEITLLLADKADTGAVALKADKTYVDATDEVLTAAIATKANSTDVYTKTESDATLENYITAQDFARKNYVNGTDETIIADNDSQDVQIEANRVAIGAIPAGVVTKTYVDGTDEATIIRVASAEVAINGIIVGSGFATTAYVNGTDETLLAGIADRYTKAEADATIEAAIAAISSTSQTANVTAGENLTAGDVVSLINSYGSVTAVKNNLAVNTSPNGAESVFQASTTANCAAVALDSTRFLVAYNGGANTTGYSRVGTVSGSAISWGTASAALDSGKVSNNITACKIDTDKVLVVCSTTTTASSGRMMVLSISGTDITVNSPVELVNSGTQPTHLSVTQLATDKALVVYKDYNGGYNGYAKVIDVSGTTPSAPAGTGEAYNTGATDYNSVSALSSTSAIVAYQDGGNSNYGTAQVLSISGTTITPGTEYVFNSASTVNIATCAINSTQAIVVGSGKGFIATNTDGAIGYGTEATYDSNGIPKIALIDSTHALFINVDSSVAYVQTYLITVSGTNLAFGTRTSPTSYQATGAGVCYLGNNKSAMVWSTSSNGYGTAAINTAFNADYSAVRGLCTATTSSGGSAPILLSGTATGLSSIVTGSQYWLAADYSMSTAPVSLAIMKNSSTQTGEIFLGVGKSATEMYFNVDYK